VDEWEGLARTGDFSKSSIIRDKYLHGCPACELSRRVNETKQQDCKYCPITAWRIHAREENSNPGEAVCENRGTPYNIWCFSLLYEKEMRMKVARKMSKMKWSWIPEYAEVEI
jgi:hypothetical protein